MKNTFIQINYDHNFPSLVIGDLNIRGSYFYDGDDYIVCPIEYFKEIFNFIDSLTQAVIDYTMTNCGIGI